MARVAVAGKWGYIDAQDRTVIPFVYDSATPFQEGLAVVERNQKAGVINKDNTVIIPLQYDGINYIGEGLFNVCLGNKCGVFDKTNKVVIPISKDVPMYDYVGPFVNGLAPVKVNHKWGYINKQGEFTAWSYQ